MSPILLVASMLPGHGPSGVEMHANAIVACAREAGYEARFISAQVDKDWRRRRDGLWRRLLNLVDRERAQRWELLADAALLERKLRRAVAAAGSADITLYTQDPLSARCALRARASPATRVVTTIHFNQSEALEWVGRGMTQPGGPLWRHGEALERDVLPRVDHVIFVSAFMRDVVLARAPDLAARASLILNFCLRPDVAKAGATDADEPAGDLIVIGTLEPRKNQRFLLDVLAACNRRGRRYSCSIVGPGPDADMLRQRAVALGLADQVNFVGHRAGAVALIPRHRALAMCSLLENMPITLIESLACGRPVLAPPVGGIPELGLHGEQGFLWPLDDPEAAAGWLIELLETPGLWARMSASASQRYDRQFAPEVLAPQWLSAILGPGRPA